MSAGCAGEGKGQSPRQGPPFFGRVDELAALEARFAAGDRLVTLLGLGSARQTGDIETSAFVSLEAGKRLLLAGQREQGEAFLDVATRLNVRVGSKKLESDVDAARTLCRVVAHEPVRASVEGYWFERRGTGRVELYRRRALRRILAALIASHGLRPGIALSVVELVEAGWPGERIHPEAGAMRVWTAVRTLRRLGLGELLASRDGGYMLLSSARLELVADPP